MSNMGYCRFENTASDLFDCMQHLDETLDSDYERSARIRLIKMAREIAEQFEDVDLDTYDANLTDADELDLESMSEEEYDAWIDANVRR